MKLSYLEQASDYDVEKWLTEELKLTPYQKELLLDREIVRFSPFYFYQRKKKEEVSALWRLTIIPFVIYYILAICFTPIKWLFTGKLGYGRNFIDNFHSKWVRKMGF